MKRTRILLIEDDPVRIETFRRWLQGRAILVEVKSAGQAMGVLKRVEPDELSGVFLDHDLNQQARTAADLSLSGSRLIDLVCQYVDNQTPILVHSMNPAGASHMSARLATNGYDVTVMPFDHLSGTILRNWVTENCEPGQDSD